MGEKKSVRLGVNLPEDLRDRFKKVAILNDTDMGTLVRDWIEDYVSDFENPRAKKKRVRPKRVGGKNEENKKAENSEE